MMKRGLVVAETPNIMTLSRVTLRLMGLMGLIVTLSINDTEHKGYSA
jgi:hypothetical protein